MGSSPLPLSSGVDITLRDAIAATISPKIKQIATDAENAELKLIALQSALGRINAGNLSGVTTASGSLGRSATITATAIQRISDAAAKADGNLQRFAQTLTVVTMASNQAAQGLNGVGGSLNNATQNTNTFASAHTRTATAVQGTTAKVYEASAAIRTFGGSIPIRAAERFLTIIPGMSVALSAAFPVFGALALVSVLVEMIEKVTQLIANWGDLKKLQDESTKSMISSEQTQIDLEEKLLQNARQQRVLTAQQNGPHAGEEQRGRAAGANFDIGQDAIALQDAKDKYLNAVNTLGDAYGSSNKVIRQRIPEYEQAASTAQTGIDAATRQLSVDKQTEAVAKSNDKYQEGKAAMAAYRQAQEALVEGWRENATEIMATSDDIGADLIHFWSMTAVAADKGSLSQRKAFDELMKAEANQNKELQRNQEQFSKQTTETIGSLHDQIDLTGDRDSIAQIKLQADAVKQLTSALEEYHTQNTQLSVTNAETQAQAQLALGQISAQTAAQDVFNAKLDAYNAVLKDLHATQAAQAAASYNDPNQRKADLVKTQGQINAVQSQKAALQANNIGQNPLSIGDSATGALRKAFPKPDFLEVQSDFQKLFTTIGDGFADSLAHSIVYATSLTKALQNVARQGLQEIISGLIKMGIQWVISEAVGKSLQVASQATTAALATATAAAWAPAAAMASLATFGANAAAADAALSSTLALAEGMSFAGSFARGGLIGGRGGGTEDANVILASRGEYVVNAKSTSQHYALLNAINSGARTVQSNVPSTGPAKQMHVTVEDHTLGGTSFAVNHIDDDHVRVVARQEIQNNTDGHVASAIANPNSKTSKAITLHTGANRRRNG